MLSYSVVSLIFAIALIGYLLARFFVSFKKSRNNISDNLPQFHFMIFLLAVMFFLVTRLVIAFFGPDLTVNSTSKFAGSPDYLLLFTVGSISSLSLAVALLLLVFTGLSFRGVKKFEYIWGFSHLMLWLIAFLTVDITVSYAPNQGWFFRSGELANYLVNLPSIVFLAYFLVNMFMINKSIKSASIKSKFNQFIIGLVILTFLIMINYTFIVKYFGNYGIDVIAIAVSSVLFYKSLKK